MKDKELAESIEQKQSFLFGSNDATMEDAQETIYEMSKMIYALKKENEEMAQILSSIE